eukprot:Rhum_TRINITY_DN7917_c0_g3::Rhum_TRINITY_DN7917_c0_g3_i1::g.25194::m.25194/K09780/K09780; uncharacterized protein
MATPRTYQMLTYEYVPDVMEKRAPHREAHLAHIKQASESGHLHIGGPFDPATDGAVLVFTGDKEKTEEWARADPYVKGGVVTKWDVKAWKVVVEPGFTIF